MVRVQSSMKHTTRALLRSNEIEVDTCQIHMIKNSRYVGMFPDSDGDNEDWNILNLIS